MDRRHFMKLAAASSLAFGGLNRISLANAGTEKRYIQIILRGGMDGLHALAPYGDPLFRQLRPKLAMAAGNGEKGLIKIDGYFGLHPQLKPLKELFDDGDLLFIPAASTGYTERSHFDGQNVLELGGGKPFSQKEGWLNRLLGELNGGERRLGLALGNSVPLTLQGDVNVQNWGQSPFKDPDEDFLERLAYSYSRNERFSEALMMARSAPELDIAGGKKSKQDLLVLAKAAGELLSQPDGPRIAVMEMGGWDTHFAQARRLQGQFKKLSNVVQALKSELGPVWDDTTLLIASEFGRKVAENGNAGTDHGYGGLVILAGGNIKGGRIAGDWKGLEKSVLYQGRDMYATTQVEGIFKTVALEVFGLSESAVEMNIFAGAEGGPVEGLI